MTGNAPLSSKGKIGENTVIEDMEDEVHELPDSNFSKATERVFDRIDIGKADLITSSKSVDMIEKLEEGFHSEYMAGHLQKIYSNESGSLDCFAFVR